MDFSPIRVLVIEDRPVDARLARVALALGGFETRTAPNIEEARALLDAFRPDCLIVDVQLPDGNGLDFTREVKSAPDHNQVRVVVVTSHTTQYGESHARAAGADAFLAKPFDVRGLPGVLHQLLDEPPS